MPSGKKDIYGVKSKRLADPKDIRAEIGAAKNAAIPANQRNSDREIAKLLAREGTTSKSGGRPAVKMPKPVQKPVQVIRTTTAYKPTPMGKKK
jgi:hypothetical protein